MGQKASAFYYEGTKIDDIRSTDAGDMQLWQSNAGLEVFYLKKIIERLKKALQPEAVGILVQREAQLPRTIVPISRLDGLLADLSDCTAVVTDLSGNNLQAELERLNRENSTMNEIDVLAVFGVLLMTSICLEKNSDFHRSLCLKNIFLVGNSIFLLNPYIKDSHISKSIEAIVRPIMNMGAVWKPEYMWNQDSRSRAANYDREIEVLIKNHRELLYEMVVSIGVIVVSLCTGRQDDYFLNADGSLDVYRIDESLHVAPLNQGH